MFCTFAHSSLIIWYMLYYIKKYPVSLFIILTVIYLSFFKPPSTEISKIPNIDKVVHICMLFRHVRYVCGWSSCGAASGETVRLCGTHVGAFVCPVLFSGAVELLQAFCTTYRGGDWLDFAANTTGAVLASLVACFVLKPRVMRKSTD